MKREYRYVVLKKKEIKKYLSLDEQDMLLDVLRAIDAGRHADGKPEMDDSVVVEADWPMFEDTWEQIENWVHEQVATGEMEDIPSNRNTNPPNPINMRHG